MKLSAAIITFNEERNLSRCLKSLVDIADEIIVVDSYSTDRTQAIAESFGARFIQHPFEGHIQQKNFALEQATGDWILSLDADEALNETLRASILAYKAHPSGAGCSMNRLTNYCGHWVKHCGWYPDSKTRLVARGKARWGGVNPHDRLDLIDGSMPTHLNGDILHYSYYTREDHLRQIEYFGKIAARELHTRGTSISTVMIVLKVVAQFFKSYILKTGFLDGATGFTISRLSAYATWRKYSLLLEMHQHS
ncbi:MAG: glycosyltransferase family 2 protein [Flavobacteriales bacterium]|jgi:glycosyltransferase involved in cell wall biosynthesis